MSPIVNHFVAILPLGITIGGRFLGFKNKFTSKFGHHATIVGHEKHLWSHQEAPLVFQGSWHH
jgi:hypothetical protein